jgi:hypothetical protein
MRVIAILLLLGTLSAAQLERPGKLPGGQGIVMLDSGPGSFRAEGEGVLVIDTLAGDPKGGIGTVYITGLEGPGAAIKVSGMREEYRERTRVCYHGKGRVEVRGKFHAVYFLGEHVKGYFEGKGMLRLYGDLDRNMRTGLFYYPGFKKDGEQVYEHWETYGRVVEVPIPKDYEPRSTSLGVPVRGTQ